MVGGTNGLFMMTSWNGNSFRVTDPLWEESIGNWRIYLKGPVTRSFDVFFGMRLNKRLNKLSIRRWFETLWRSLWCHSNVSGHDCNTRLSNMIEINRNCLFKAQIKETSKLRVTGLCEGNSPVDHSDQISNSRKTPMPRPNGPAMTVFDELLG